MIEHVDARKIQAVLFESYSDELNAAKCLERGIPLQTANEYRVGYIHETIFGGVCRISYSYCIPMFGVDGAILGLKLHRNFVSTGQSKCYWPFSADDCKTLWPPPEWFRMAPLPASISDWPAEWIEVFETNRDGITNFVDEHFRDDLAEWQARKAFGKKNPLLQDDEWLFLCGGELKALALIGAGLRATAPMTGESDFWTAELVSRIAGQKVCIVYDDDNQGQNFRDATTSALIEDATELKVITFGVKPGGMKIDANDVAAVAGPKGLSAQVQHLLNHAPTINAEDWKHAHPEAASGVVAAGVLEADLQALETEYLAPMYRGHAREARKTQYQRYLEHYPPAISGARGHETLLKASDSSRSTP